MRLGFFGGTFDPPHWGHLAVGRAAAERFRLAHCLLAPTARQPLKRSAASASFADRVAMVRLLCAEERSGRFEASEIDGPLEGDQPNFTVNTLLRLRRSLESGLPDQALDIFVIAGADAFLEIRRWRSPEQLLALAEWIVVSRPGFDEDRLAALRLTPQERARVHWLGGVEEPVSATDVRACLAAGQDCTGLVPPSVLAYIGQHGLYCTQTGQTAAPVLR